MKYRKLRIAASATCVLLCALVLAAWTQGGGVRVSGYFPSILLFEISSSRFSDSIWRDAVSVYATIDSGREHDVHWALIRFAGVRNEMQEGFDFQGYSNPLGFSASAPHWFLALTFGLCAIVPWTPIASRITRFSLRTLLIATTLVATTLGLIVWISG